MKMLYGFGLFLLCSGCGAMAARQQLDTARTRYQTHLTDVQQRVSQWQQDQQELASDFATFRRKLTTDQAEKLNRALALQNDESWAAFITSLTDRQGARLQDLRDRTATLTNEQQLLVLEIGVLQTEGQQVASLERRYETDRMNMLLALNALQQQQQNQQLLRQRQSEQAQQSMNQMQLLNELRQINGNLQGLHNGW